MPERFGRPAMGARIAFLLVNDRDLKGGGREEKS